MPVTNDTPISHVSDTAIWVATFRAMETKRADALFQDPLAGLLVGERGPAIVKKMKTSRPTGWAVVIRTRIIDDYISAAIKQGVDTIVNMGAGLDTRPYRMDLPSSLRWIEVDYPHMMEFKDEQLKNEKPRCRLERVKLDLADGPARRAFLEKVNSQSKQIFALTEGVVPYLEPSQVASLADDIRAQDNFKSWTLDYFSPDLMKYMNKGSIKKQMRNAPFKFSPQDWFKFFDERRWKVREMRYMGEEGRRLQRPFILPLFFRILTHFASKKRQEQYDRMSGYAVLEPK